MSTTAQNVNDIRLFQVDVPEENVAELRGRITATTWPSEELVEDASQGVQLPTMQALAQYWVSEYDFGRVAARLRGPNSMRFPVVASR